MNMWRTVTEYVLPWEMKHLPGNMLPLKFLVLALIFCCCSGLCKAARSHNFIWGDLIPFWSSNLKPGDVHSRHCIFHNVVWVRLLRAQPECMDWASQPNSVLGCSTPWKASTFARSCHTQGWPEYLRNYSSNCSTSNKTVWNCRLMVSLNGDGCNGG